MQSSGPVSQDLTAEMSVWSVVLFLIHGLHGHQLCPRRCDCPPGNGVVWCNWRNLMVIPFDIPQDTLVLYLDSNWIVHISSGAFHGLKLLHELHLADNLIESISPAAFHGLGNALRLLDLSGNKLRKIDPAPFVMLTWVRLELYNNPWHCDCSLQELIKALSLGAETAEDIVCTTATWKEYVGKTLSHLVSTGVNFCVTHQKNTDFAMLLTMFVWFGVVITYVIYYIRRNQAESRRHLEYLKSLPVPRSSLQPEEKEVDEDNTLSTIL
ncbi:PREDICTED: leucine-rich repeat-containing protein 3-like [Thamnophis sirtalis]|uniref:Leucine-rich repeat-containing protein 3-like n=1 Tax=Thamnophis sirtalis TaxID=35019 RepID=A0A6I9XAW5_9SAUR|nr:PREDICTED: leucine-rich repeat-containing protein 3-like [Thamnophis sirtalis]